MEDIMKELKLILIIFFSIISISSLALAQDERDIIKAEEGSDAEEFKTDRLAIVVGINNYLNTKVPDLNYSEQDAKLIRSILENEGVFNVLYYSSEPEERPATKDNILNGLKDANQLAKNGMIKTFVFYFAGHGYRQDNENYLAPMEVNLNDIAYSGIALSKVIEIINDIQKNAKTMVFLDACRNEVDSNQRGGSEAWTEDETPGSGLGIIYSTSEGEYSYELKEEGHGIFTLFLAEGLLGKADSQQYGGNEDGFVTFFELASYVSKKMMEWSISNDEQLSQTPRVTALEINGDFILTKPDQERLIDDINSNNAEEVINTNNEDTTNHNSNLNNDNDTDKSDDKPEIPTKKWSFNINLSGGLGFSPSMKMSYDFNNFFSMGVLVDMVIVDMLLLRDQSDNDYINGYEDDYYYFINLGILFKLDILSFIPINHYTHDLYLLYGTAIDILYKEKIQLVSKISLSYYYNFYNGIIVGGGFNFEYLMFVEPGIILIGLEGTFGLRF
jgi:uncharacterized caspase-like protein